MFLEIRKEIKENNKKDNNSYIVIRAIVLVLVVIIFQILLPFVVLPNEIRELNHNINFPYKFGFPLKKYNFEGTEWKKVNDYYEHQFINNRKDVIIFDEFPDLACEDKLTYYCTSNPEFLLFGFHIGDNIDDVDKILKKRGYRVKDRTMDSADYNKGRVNIWIKINYKCDDLYDDKTESFIEYTSETVEAIDISLICTDWLHKGYYK